MAFLPIGHSQLVLMDGHLMELDFSGLKSLLFLRLYRARKDDIGF
jgi:hypothetical protein